MGTLFVVATPIGNLEDLSLRALRILKEVDLIAAEDTRHTKILLDHYGVKTPMTSYHRYTRARKIDYILNRLGEGKSIALVCDAGTPGISDPGWKLINAAVNKGIEVVPIPGPSAFLAAASVSGIPLSQFIYLGFLPKKGRKKLLNSLKDEERVIIFYESPHRVLKTLTEIKEIFGDREVVVCRELTKKFEEIIRGRIKEVIKEIKPRGEFVVIIKPEKLRGTCQFFPASLADIFLFECF
ncbi:MAG: 16S rRNA (cytidine(1402)-2'-O)-methyltransferase [Actinomycetota bacterium]|nr:16S rRNA (cytidine(1402)-2'-O)-methyltransferase [Actinomycetota bacterium]MDI6822508.1 16S rRNA (cytidine(1402)-2'-O)-methyltransferase [Actinomycetota bacterium]